MFDAQLGLRRSSLGKVYEGCCLTYRAAHAGMSQTYFISFSHIAGNSQIVSVHKRNVCLLIEECKENWQEAQVGLYIVSGIDSHAIKPSAYG